MIRIDDTLLEEIGLISLPKAERDQMLRQIYETLEMRVGMKLAERMTDQQLDEFERFIDTNDEAGALKWLETNFPDYKQVVAAELEKLKAEIKKDSATILQTMQGQGQLPGAAGTPVSQQPYSQPQPVAQGVGAPVSQAPGYAPQQQGVATPSQPIPDLPQPTPQQQAMPPAFGQQAFQPTAQTSNTVQPQLPVTPLVQSDDQSADDNAVASSGSIPPPPSF